MKRPGGFDSEAPNDRGAHENDVEPSPNTEVRPAAARRFGFASRLTFGVGTPHDKTEQQNSAGHQPDTAGRQTRGPQNGARAHAGDATSVGDGVPTVEAASVGETDEGATTQIDPKVTSFLRRGKSSVREQSQASDGSRGGRNLAVTLSWLTGLSARGRKTTPDGTVTPSEAEERESISFTALTPIAGAAATEAETETETELSTVATVHAVGTAGLHDAHRTAADVVAAEQRDAVARVTSTSKDSGTDRVAAAERAVKVAERERKQRERRDSRRFRARSRTRTRHWLLGVGAVVLLGAFVAAGVFTPVMAVREVEVLGGEQIDSSAVQSALERFDGVPLALVGEQEIHRALEPFPLIQRYSVERIPPHTLRVQIEERQPVVAVVTEAGYRLVDAAGVLTAEVAEVPAGIVLAVDGVADPSSATFLAAARVIRDLPEDLRGQFATVSATSEQDISFGLHSGVSVFWGDASHTQRKAVVLRAMLASVGGASRIDVSAPEAPVFQ